MDMLNWITPATLTGCRATAVPIGRTPDGLPVGFKSWDRSGKMRRRLRLLILL